jgi:hypothetical protein
VEALNYVDADVWRFTFFNCMRHLPLRRDDLTFLDCWTYAATVKSIPAIARLDYLDIILLTLRDRATATVDEVRVAIGRAVEDLALRGEARQTRDWQHPLAYRDTAVDCLRELMRWNVIDVTPLADSAEAFERIRNLPIHLTADGNRIAELGAPERRDIFGQKLLAHYSVFRDLLGMLDRNDVLLPELSDTEVRSCFADLSRVAEDQDGWDQIALQCERALTKQETIPRPRLLSPPTNAKLGEDIGKYLRRRFLRRTPKKVKEITGAVNKAMAHAILRAAGFHGDWNNFDRCLRWGRDLYLSNDGRHVFGVSGWLSWSASKIRWESGSFLIERRGASQFRDLVRVALIKAYSKIADARRSVGVQVPLIPIYEVRETAAFECRVCDEVVDRVLGEMATERRSGDPLVQLHLADLRGFVPSAKPFRFTDDKRYFYVSMHRPDQSGEGIELC